MTKYSFPPKLYTVLGLCVGIVGSVAGISAQQQVKPTHELKVGARNSTIRNIGSFQTDSALIFPKRDAGKDTAKSKALRKKGAFFLDSTTFVTWFFDGKHFRRATDSSIYNSDGKILQPRVVDIDGAKKAKLQFKNGAVHIDTLLLKKSKIKGTSRDSFLVRFQDTVKYIPFDSLRTIYNKDDSIKKPRLVTLQSSDKKSQTLHFAQGQIKIDSLLLPHLKIAEKDDSVLTIFKDSVRKRNIAEIIKSGKNIYTTDDSIKSARKVTLRGKNNAKSSVYFKDGQFSLDTLLIRKKNRGTSTDSFLVRFKDTVRYIPFDSLRTIYNKDDSIRHTGKSGKRIITLNNKKLIFRNTQKNNSVDSGRVGILQDNPLYTLDIATASFMKGSGNSNSNGDSIAVRISHNVEENKLGYGLLLSESSNKATGKSAIAFEGKGKNKKNNKDEDIQFKKAAIWAQNGKDFKRPLLGISTADSNRKLQERMWINHNGNVEIGAQGVHTDDFPARLVVNNKYWHKDALQDIGAYDKQYAIDENAGILINVAGKNKSGLKYGMIMREADYDANTKLALGFYNGGFGSSQNHFMHARLWTNGGSNVQHPLFGIDVAGTVTGNGKVKPNLPTRMVINEHGYLGVGAYSPNQMIHVARDGQKNYILVEAGATGTETTTNGHSSSQQNRSANNNEVKYGGLWLTEKGNTYGWKVQNNPNTDMLEFAHTNSQSNSDHTPMVMSADGNVGINTGITTDKKPTANLQVNGTIKFYTGAGSVSGSNSGSTGSIHFYGLPTINPNANGNNNGQGGITVNRNGYLLKEDSMLVIKSAQVEKVRADHIVNFYTQNDSIHNQDRTVSMKGHSIVFENDKEKGLMIFRNSKNDNLVKIESDVDQKKKGGLWFTGMLKNNTGGKFKEGFKMVNNPENHQLEFYTTSQNLNSGNSSSSDQQQILLPGNIKSSDNKILSIHQDGVVQICGAKDEGNSKDIDKNNFDNKHHLPTLKFQRENGRKYWFIRFDDKNDRLYFGKKYGEDAEDKKVQVTTTQSQGAQTQQQVSSNHERSSNTPRYHNRMSIDENVVVIENGREAGQYHNADFELNRDGITGSYGTTSGSQKFQVSYQSQNLTKNDIPALFVNGTCQAKVFTVSSDSALKRDVHNIEGALSKVLQLRPVTYYWKDTSEGSGFSRRLQIGFIAQEVQKVFPNLVQHIWSERTEPTLGVNYIGVIPEVVGAVQELHNRLQKVENEKAEMQQKLAEQQQKLATEIQVRQNLEKREQDLEKRVQALEKLLLKQSAASTENLSNSENIAVQQSLQE